jgi:hypothetical protein
MRIFLVSGFLALLFAPALRAERACSQMDLEAAVQRAKAVQTELLTYKITDEIDEGVPAPLQAQIRAFKESLAALADTALQCAPEDANPKPIETTLAKLLDANKPVINEVYDPKKPPQLDHIYGDEIDVKVSAPANLPQVLLARISFGIECGYDAMLLAYELRHGHWQRMLRWQSGNFDQISGAFGDFFSYQVVPQKDSGSWLIAVAHGHPWCTSRWSGFDLDLIRPSTDNAPQQVVFHKKAGYVRDTDPIMRIAPDGFQLRLETGSMDAIVMTRPVVYRYRVSGRQVVRVQPIALNGRDFVDEWLQSPWDESKGWSAPSELIELESAQRKIEKLRNSDPNAKEWPSLTYGPVRSCSDSPSHFQVDLDLEWLVNQQTRPDSPTFFQIQEGKNSFTMLSASGKPDPHCTGPDIMAHQ